jgi:hypothetical protein
MLEVKSHGDLVSTAGWGGAATGEAAWALRMTGRNRLTIPKHTVREEMARDVINTFSGISQKQNAARNQPGSACFHPRDIV